MKAILFLFLLAVTVIAVDEAESASTPPAAAAKPKDTPTSIEIFCDGPVHYTMTNATVVYTNNVRATDSKNMLICDLLTMQLSESVNAAALLDSSAPSTPKTTNSPVQWIVAEGNVVLSNRQVRALCGKAVYDFTTELVTLSGSARIVPVLRIQHTITNRMDALRLRWESCQAELGQNETEAAWRFTGLQRMNKAGAVVGEPLQGTVRAVQDAEQWQIKGDGDLANIQFTLPSRPFLETASGWSASSLIIFNLKTGDIAWQPPFEFYGATAGAMISLPGAGK